MARSEDRRRTPALQRKSRPCRAGPGSTRAAHLEMRMTIDDAWTVTEDYNFRPDADILEFVFLENKRRIEGRRRPSMI